jgi:hypothetical protein
VKKSYLPKEVFMSPLPIISSNSNILSTAGVIREGPVQENLFSAQLYFEYPSTRFAVTWPDFEPSIAWGGELKTGTLHVTLDGVDVTSYFNVDSTGARATAKLSTSIGNHTLTAIAELGIEVVLSGNTEMEYTPRSETISFTVQDISFFLLPDVVILTQGENVDIAAQISHWTNYTGPLDFYLQNPPPGVDGLHAHASGSNFLATMRIWAEVSAPPGNTSTSIAATGYLPCGRNQFGIKYVMRTVTAKLSVYIINDVTIAFTFPSSAFPETWPQFKASVAWTGEWKPGTLKVEMDGIDLTSLFSIAADGSSASGQINTNVGHHSLKVSAQLGRELTVDSNKVTHYADRSASIDFDVRDFTFTCSPAQLKLNQYEKQDVTLLIDRSGGFSGPITFLSSGLPSGVTCRNGYAAAAQTKTTMPLAASMTILPCDTSVSITASAQLPSGRSGSTLQYTTMSHTARFDLHLVIAVSFAMNYAEVIEPRSPWSDTDTAAFGYVLNWNGTPQTKSKFIGDNLSNGWYPIEIGFNNVEIGASDSVLILYSIVNASDASVATKVAENLVGEALKAGAKALVSAAVNDSAIGAAIGAELGSVIPGLGTMLGALAGATAGFIWGLFTANCDGPVAFGARAFTGLDIGKLIQAQSPNIVSFGDPQPGTSSPAGCGCNSNYNVYWGFANYVITPDSSGSTDGSTSGSTNSNSTTHGDGCFAADTPILMGDGSLKPISKLEIGDMVCSVDAQTGAYTACAVVERGKYYVSETVKLTLSTGEVIEVSPQHRFFSPGNSLTQARDLNGTKLLCAKAMENIHVLSIDQKTGPTAVYNIGLKMAGNAGDRFFVGYTHIMTYYKKY